MGKSSKDKRDAYYRLAKEQGWRARSAFKLLQLDEEFNLFEGVTRVVDLCAAPGSWSQVLSRVLIKGEKFGRRAWNEKIQDFQDVVKTAIESEDLEDDWFDNEEQKAEYLEQARLAKQARAASELSDLFEAENPKSNENTSESILETPESPPTEPEVKKQIRIVAIDLQPISPLEGITTIRADITDPSTVPALLHALDPDTFDPNDPSHLTDPSKSTPVDLIISDGAPDVTGLHDFDIYIQSQLLYSALNLAIRVLKPGGKFVAKIFRAKDVDLIYSQLRIVFAKVTVAKPRSSRASSLEAFVVCEAFNPPEGLRDVILGIGEPLKSDSRSEKTGRKMTDRGDGVTILELGSEEEAEAESNDESALGNDHNNDDEQRRIEARERAARWIAPFLACGDLDAPDADATYRLPEGYKSLDPVQPPVAPPYKKALEMRRAAGGAYGKTKKQGT